MCSSDLLVGRLPPLGKPDAPATDLPRWAWSGPAQSKLEVQLDGHTGHLDALRLVDEAGAPFLEAEVDAPDFPQRLVGRLPSRGTTAELNFSSWKPASPPETAFTLVIPPSATVTDVSLRRPE